MLGDFLLRLAVALPLVCGLAVASLFAVKRGWVRLPPLLAGSGAKSSVAVGGAGVLSVVAVKSLSPSARVAVIRFAGRELLVGLNGQAMVLLAEAGGGAVSGVGALGEAAVTRLPGVGGRAMVSPHAPAKYNSGETGL